MRPIMSHDLTTQKQKLVEKAFYLHVGEQKR